MNTIFQVGAHQNSYLTDLNNVVGVSPHYHNYLLLHHFAGDRSELLPLSCFDWKTKSLKSNKKGLALNPCTDKLWPPGKVLRVYFMGGIPEVKYDHDWITTDKIIEWMNEWSDDKSSVPKFKKTEGKNGSNVRVNFIGE